MRKISILGGGQSGLQIGFGLLREGYDVTVMTNRTAEEVRDGRVLSSQCMFHTALQNERNIGINDWEDACPPVEGIEFNIVGENGDRALHWAHRLDHYAQSVDQRVKIPGWMRRFEREGGKLVIADAGIDELDNMAHESDLVLVASGKGEIGRLFERDDEKSDFDKPMRALALSYVNNMTPRPDHSTVCFNVIPGVGEYFVFPALTTTGPCEIMVMEGIVGGPMDTVWQDVKTPADHLAASKWILETYIPWEAERCRKIELTDPNGILAGRFPPTIRKPVARLPSGRTVMGVADTVVLNDPLTGQGSNNASKCARIVTESILQRGARAFDEEWMQATFDRYWDYARWVVKWTSAFLVEPQEPIPSILGAAQEMPELARIIANGFDNPPDFFPWLVDAVAAQMKLKDLNRAA
ncbi:MAG: styrene monooxygenase/indole monooxygenase family protein [Alphaproteobacteria bacterium]